MLRSPLVKTLRTSLIGAPVLAGLYVGTATASMGNLATTYGLLPNDIATAQSLSLFNSQASAVYYNPAYLAKDSRGELTAGLMHADHSLKIKSLGGDGALDRQGDKILDKPTQHMLLSMKSDLSSMTKMEHPLYLGVMIGVEKYGEEMMAFDSKTSETGQYFEYGRQPLFMNIGMGTKVWRGINFGASLRVTLHADAKLDAATELDGASSHERMNVSATPSMKPIIGASIDWGETFCASDDCWFDGFESAISYRAKSNTHSIVDSRITIDGMLPDPGMHLRILTLDSYQPDIVSVGSMYGTDRWKLGATAEFQMWSDLYKEMKKDTLAENAVDDMKFKDIVIPRVGGEYQINDNFRVMAGAAYSPTPLDSKSSTDLNLLDGDKVQVGLGLTAEYPKTRFLAFPVRFDLGYQYQKVLDEKFDLYNTRYDNGETSYESVEAKGDVHIVTGSMTLKF